MNSPQNLTVKDHQRNLSLNIFHEMFWGFGIAFHSTYAVIPLFLSTLGAPDIIIGSVAGVFTISAAVLQIFSAFWGSKIRNITKAVVAVHGLLLPPILASGFIFAFVMPTGQKSWMIYYLCYILFSLSLGFVFPIWADFLEKVHLKEKRGSFIGISFAFNSAAGLFGGIVVKKMLSSAIPFPANFGYGFLIYGGCIAAATLLFFMYRTKPITNHQPNINFHQFLRGVKKIFREDHNLRRYIFSRILLTVNYPAISLYAVYSQDKLEFDISEAGVFTAITVVVAGISSYVTGKIGDRWGHKNAFVLIWVAYLLALITAISAQTMSQIYLIFIFLGLGQGGFLTSAMSLVYEFAGEKDKKIYFALIDSLTAPFVLISIVLTGILIPILSIEVVLKGIGVFIILGMLSLIFFTKEPKTAITEPTPVEPFIK